MDYTETEAYQDGIRRAEKLGRDFLAEEPMDLAEWSEAQVGLRNYLRARYTEALGTSVSGVDA